MRYILVAFWMVLLFSCTRQTRDKSNLKPNSDSLISLNNHIAETNPYRIRDSIKHFAIIPKVTLNVKLKIFKSLIDSLQNCYKSNEVNQYAEIDKYNYLIVKYILNIVENHPIFPDVLAKGPIKLIRSTDQKVGVYSWDEHTGSSMNSYINVLVYKTSNKKMKAIHLEWINSKVEYLPYAGMVKKIYLLSNKPYSSIYMIQTEGTGCSNCYLGSMFGFSITNDSINLNYPLFGNRSDYILEIKDSNFREFQYNSQKKEFTVNYFLENSLINTNSKNKDLVFEKWIFNGEKFGVVQN